VSGHVTTTSESRRPFVPGMGVDWLLPIYDPFTKLLGLDGARRALLHQADLRPIDRVLDIGCGTGSLLLLVKRLVPGVDAVGVDPDERALARATRKAQRAGAQIQFDRGFADALRYPDTSFNRVFSSFMFHHLGRDEKGRALLEIRRVLKPDGSLHLLDFGGRDTAAHWSRLPGLHSHHRLTDNDARTVLRLLADAGFTNATRSGDRAVLGGFGRIVYYRAERSVA
jgi:ubiquinone/menaquinone biosynthesis C-methylase UbiE